MFQYILTSRGSSPDCKHRRHQHERGRDGGLEELVDARPHVRLKTGPPVSQYAGNEGCAGLAGAEPHA